MQFSILKNKGSMTIYKWVFIFLFTISCFASEQHYLLTSIPKSGSHLLVKLVSLLTGGRHVPGWNGALSENQVEDVLLNLDYQERFPFCHANEPHYLTFAKKHPEYVKLFQIRDLRDVLISAVFYFNSKLEALGLTSFDEKLAFVLTSNTVYSNWIENNAKLVTQWTSLPNTYLIRFEDLVGEKGLGSEEKQRELITLISSLLHIPLIQDQLDWIVTNLFGKEDKHPATWTFRKGLIGEWKHLFQSHHKKLFNERWGIYQELLGYPTFDDEESVLNPIL